MRRVGLGILIGIAASAGVILVYRAVEAQPGPSAVDRMAAERVVAAVKLPSSCCKRAVRTACTSTSWSVCVVTVFIPGPLDACQDWSVNVHHDFIFDPKWLQTYDGCVHS
jgi:hypothetical protein